MMLHEAYYNHRCGSNNNVFTTVEYLKSARNNLFNIIYMVHKQRKLDKADLIITLSSCRKKLGFIPFDRFGKIVSVQTDGLFR